MGFFDKKEDVLEIELTAWGKHLLSLGSWEPTYYAFFDDDILYDGEASGILESQNDADKRIRFDTPALRRPADTNSAQTRTGWVADWNGGPVAGSPTQTIAENSLAHIQSHQNLMNLEEGQTPTGRILQYLFMNNATSDVMTAGLGPSFSLILQPLLSLGAGMGVPIPSSVAASFGLDPGTTMAPGAGDDSPGSGIAGLMAGGMPEIEGAAGMMGSLTSLSTLTDVSTPPGNEVDTSLDTLQYRGALPIGTSDMKTPYAPSWSIKCLENTVSSSQTYYASNLTSSTSLAQHGYITPIPQLDVEINYKTFYAKISDDPAKGSPKILQLTPPLNTTGLALFVEQDYLLLQIDEENVEFGKENFDMEVYAYGSYLSQQVVSQLPWAFPDIGKWTGGSARGLSGLLGSGVGGDDGTGAGMMSSIVGGFLTTSADPGSPGASMGSSISLSPGAAADDPTGCFSGMTELFTGGALLALKNTVEKFMNIATDEQIPTSVLQSAGLHGLAAAKSSNRSALTRDLYSARVPPTGDASGEPCDD